MTGDGYDYVREAIAEHVANGRGNAAVLNEWSEFYDIPMPKLHRDENGNPEEETNGET